MTRFYNFWDWFLFRFVLPVFTVLTFILVVMQGMDIDWWPLLMGGK